MDLKQIMKDMIANTGKSVLDYSMSEKVLLVFLRHFGCVYCRDSMVELSEKIKSFSGNVLPIMVHMTDNDTAESYFKQYMIQDVIHVSDPACKFYLGFGLVKGSFSQLFGLKNAIRGFEIAAKRGILPTTAQIGDGLQMPGIFIINQGIIEDKFIHKYAADRPNYQDLLTKCQL